MFKSERLKEMLRERDIYRDSNNKYLIHIRVDNEDYFVEETEGHRWLDRARNAEPKILKVLEEHDRYSKLVPIEDFKYYLVDEDYNYINDSNNTVNYRVARRTKFIPNGIAVKAFNEDGHEIEVPTCDKYEFKLDWVKKGAVYPITMKIVRKLGFKDGRLNDLNIDKEFNVSLSGVHIKKIEYAHELELIIKAIL